MSQPVRYRMIDCFKGIACLAVVLIHFNLPDEAGNAAKAMMTFAVPFFFFVSGFFMPDKNLMLHRGRTWKKLKHILTLIAVAAVVYFVFTLVWYNLMYKDWNMQEFIQKEMTLPSLMKLFLSCDPFVYGHLWYLIALAYCYLIFLVADGWKVSNWLLAAAVPMMVGFFLMAEFKGLLGLSVYKRLLGSEEFLCLFNMPLFRAFPIFMFGMVFRKNEAIVRERFMKVPGWVFGVVIILGCGVAVAERYLLGVSQFYLGTFASFLTMAVYSISHPDQGPRCLEFIGSKLSLHVYILHTAAGKFVDLIAQRVLHLTGNVYFKWSRWLLAMIASLLVAWVVNEVSTRRKAAKKEKALS